MPDNVGSLAPYTFVCPGVVKLPVKFAFVMVNAGLLAALKVGTL